MNRTEIMFFFDTEDYTSNRSADAIYDWASMCSDEGITGHFAVVGLLAKQLSAWGRNDVISALKPHIIGTHSYGHSLHPDICEITDLEDFNAAYAVAKKEENEALRLINSVLSPARIMFACPPGNSKSYAAMYLYADMGIPFYCDTIFTNARNTGIYACNQLHIDYTISLETLFLREPQTDINELLNDLHNKKDRVILYTHPNMSVKTEAWDRLNYNKSNLRPFGEWIEAADRDPEQTKRFYSRFRELIKAVKADDRFEITNLGKIEAKQKPRIAITQKSIAKIRQSLAKGLSPISSPSLSLSDAFCGVCSLLRGGSSYKPLKSYGFLEAPQGVNASCRVSGDELRAAAQNIDISGFLPNKIRVGEIDIGPADFMLAGLEVLDEGLDWVEITPKPQLPDLYDFSKLRDFRLKNTWIHSPKLLDAYLSDRARLQSWTIRYE